ncbi:MAG: hypothetical protein JWQ39_236 [Glaciihabitans sp.]|jgi:hypothetical protein|nr:hypothetical protein [Glaciihabitans sp.]
MNNNYGYAGWGVLIGAIVLVYVTVVFVIVVAVYVLNGFAFMRLFRKVGIEPWAAWVPIFINWRILELGGQQGWLSLLALVSPGAIVTAVFEAVGAYRTGLAFRKPGGFVVLFIFFPFVWAFILGADNEVYDPDLIRQAGYGPPLAGYGSLAYDVAHQQPST